MARTLAEEIGRAGRMAHILIDEYAAWGGQIRYGDVTHALYLDTLDFVNFRIETADSCLLLLAQRKVADALGLCRSLLENYLLLILMCRGTKFFRLESTNLKGTDFKARLAAKQAELQQLKADHAVACLTVEEYSRRSGHIMYVFEGLHSPDTPGFRIPVHYVQFREFDPEAMRLKDEDYFQYYERPAHAQKAIRKHRQDQGNLHRFYLSYDSLLYCLELNGLTDGAAEARIQAHYTFLGRFLHPTHNAARDLHEHSNVYNDRTRIGLHQTYTETAVLLGYLYVCYLLAAVLDETANFFEQAPRKYMAEPGTAGIRTAAARVTAAFPYFWFLWNDPPLYDRFNYCANHATEEELAAWGGYAHVPVERVPFSQYIYSHLQHALCGWSNSKAGQYRSPLA